MGMGAERRAPSTPLHSIGRIGRAMQSVVSKATVRCARLSNGSVERDSTLERRRWKISWQGQRHSNTQNPSCVSPSIMDIDKIDFSSSPP